VCLLSGLRVCIPVVGGRGALSVGGGSYIRVQLLDAFNVAVKILVRG
jgi:hypothetical protein